MRHLVPILLPLLACASGPGAVADGGVPPNTNPAVCFAPRDGGPLQKPLVAPVPGCSQPAGQTGVIDLAEAGWSIQGGVMVVPASAPGTPLPVVLAFHGAFGTGQVMRANLAIEAAADTPTIFVYPNAVRGTWDIGPQSLDGRLVETLLGRLAQSYCIDPARISIAGFSAGAVFTLYLGCNVPDSFHAMAVIAGTSSRFDGRCCKSAIPAFFIHGTADQTIPPFDGEQAREELRERDGCGALATPLDSPAGAHCLAYPGCRSPLAVDYCEWPGDHAIPSWAGEQIWDFFSRP